ncbi:hypothetical protein NMG60_11007478 [Bertholletia excelsa]
MERIYKELDEAKAEIENLREEHRRKTELSDSLMRTHNEQLIKIQEANTKIKKQAQELNEKSDQISLAKQMYEELKSSLKEKEGIIKHLSSANDNLRIKFDEKLRKLEEENRELATALEEANVKNMDQEQKLNALNEEVKGLKLLLSSSEKKTSDEERKTKASKELIQRDNMLLTLEEENQKIQDQLKWKKEQFKHLEEAHEKLRSVLEASKKEWEQEKAALIEEISRLQTDLDSQTRISEGLQSRLQMCNQALAHEESRRKTLEVQLSENKTCFDNVFAECQEAKLKIECLTDQRDKDVASLRGLLGTKEILQKEMEYQVRRLEQENQELRLSLKELQEAQIHEAGNSSSLSKLRTKLKGLEQAHRDCPKTLRAKESEWTSKIQRMEGELTDCRSLLEGKDSVIRELKLALEDCHLSIMQLELQNEEASLMVMMLKSVISEAQLKFAHKMADMELKYSERDQKVSFLMKQLEMKNAALDKAQAELKEDHRKIETLSSKVQSLCLLEQQQIQLQDELERHKENVSKMADLDLKNSEREEKVSLLMKELEMKTAALEKAQSKIEEDREEIECLSSKVRSLCIVEQQQIRLQDELERHKEMLKESAACQLRLNEQILNMADMDLKNSEREEKVQSLCLLEQEQIYLQHELERHKEMLKESVACQLELKEQISNMADMDLRYSEREQKVSILMKELEIKSAALERAQAKIRKDHEQNESLLSKVQSMALVEQQHEEMLKESEGCQLQLKKQVSKMESDLKKVSRALDRANDELTEKFCEGNALEFELQIWKSVTERLKNNLEQNQHLRKQVESSLLAQVEIEVTLKEEKETLSHALEERDRRIDDLQRQLVLLDEKFKTRSLNIECLEQECMRKEIEGAIMAHINAEKTFKREKDTFHRLEGEKDQRFDELHQLVVSLEEKLKSSNTSFLLQLADKQAELDILYEAWQKIATTAVLKEIEIHEKKLFIAELENDFSSLLKKLESEQETLSRSEEEQEGITAELKAKMSETKKLTSDLRASNAVVGKLETENRTLIKEVKKLLSDKENLLNVIWSLSERIDRLSVEDMQLMGAWERVMQKLDKNGIGLELNGDDNDLFDTPKENLNNHTPFTAKRVEASTDDERSPLRALNNKMFQ